jgi:predicted ATPase/class 3 adenylate cyclase/DNA-binding SARP family transcriptional activator
VSARWRIELLGRLRAVQESGEESRLPFEEVTEFGTRKAAVLLAYLAYHLGRSQPREELIELLWPEGDLKRGRARLSNDLSRLRQRLEPPGVPAGAVIRADHTAISLNPSAVSTDVAAYTTALQAAERATDPAEQIRALSEAVECYGGELVPGRYEEWILQERGWLAERHLHALSRLVPLLEQSGEPRRALEYCRRAVRADRLREEAHWELIRLLAATGQPRAALRQYQELERLLREELDARPEPATRELVRAIEQELKEAALRGPCPSLEDVEEVDHEESRGTLLTRSQPAPPSGTVTFLLTDIEGSTASWERAGKAFRQARATHHALLRETFRRHGGYEFKETGDGFLVAFQSAMDAVACAVAGQQALAKQEWSPAVGEVWVRAAIHTGEVTLEQGEYAGPVLNHASRVLGAAHGGQILCSESTAGLLRRSALEGLGPGVQLLELGVYRLRDIALPERLFQICHPQMARREFPAPLAEQDFTDHLPPSFRAFFGREQESAQLEALLLAPETRLVTLTGPGGSGKTRLALAVARRLLEPFRGAVWFVRLADLEDPDRLFDRIGETLRLPRSPAIEPLAQIAAAFARRGALAAGDGAALLVLDNFEHLVPEGAARVEELLERVPSLTCLVTSRQRLYRAGEREFHVLPLPIPEDGAATPQSLAGCASVQLFVDRAREARPDFQLTPTNAPDVAAICRWLEGMPLAISLVAARAQVLTPAQMRERLRKGIAVPQSPRPHDPEHHRSLTAAFDTSYRLLSEELQRFFARLSVFRGGWSLEAAESVCDEPLALDYLAQLRDCSLVLAEEVDGDADAGAGEIRFRMLGLLREYARERLAPEQQRAMAARHAAYYLALAEEAEPALVGSGQVEWLRRLEREHHNLRAALEWHRTAGSGEHGLRLAGALWKFWLGHGHLREGRGWLAQMLARASRATAPRLKALLGAGTLAFYQGDHAATQGFAAEARELARALQDGGRLAHALVLLGWVELFRGAYGPAEALFTEGEAHARKADDLLATALALHSLGFAAHGCGRAEQGRLLLEQSRALFRQSGDIWGLAFSGLALTRVALRDGDHKRAAEVGREVLELSRRLGYPTGAAEALRSLGVVSARQGEYLEAIKLLKESLSLQQALGARNGMLECLQAIAEVALGVGEGERAARLLGAADSLRAQMSISIQPPERAEFDCRVAKTRARLTAEEFAAAWAEGQELSLEEALAEL